MEGKPVMLINPVVMTKLIPLYVKIEIVHLQRAVEMSRFGTEKILVFHRQPYYRYYYYISRMLPYQKKRRDCVIFFRPRALLQTSFVFERYLLVLILTRAIIIYGTLSSFVTCLSRASAA